jgi:YrbI family 3-deoxy-D-manno-octulosonate 8-phosphate phosphatase
MQTKPEENIVIIPARGGSKGIPRKNLQLLGGRPLVEHSIEHALSARSAGRVVVSTDDDEIAAVTKKCGAEVIRRPADISGDLATSEAALQHALDWLRETENYRPELVIFLQPTSPLRAPVAVDEAVSTLTRNGADSLFSACPQHGFVWRRHNGELESVTYDYRRRIMRQNGPEHFVENGSIYVFRPWVLERTGARLGGKIAIYLMDYLHSMQIDDWTELALAEELLPLIARNKPSTEQIRLLVLDFDGVMTDNRVLVHEDGREAVLCDRSDGWGIAKLRQAGLEVIVLSTETNSVVASRCCKLSIDYACALQDKLATLRDIAAIRHLEPKNIAYAGNDVNDIACLRWVGLPIAVADAVPEVKAVARWITQRPGGAGAVREIADAFLAGRPRLHQTEAMIYEAHTAPASAVIDGVDLQAAIASARTR